MLKELVTVAVLSYRSAPTIIETLNSIMVQSYGSKNIQLIISDDGSPDNTVDIIKPWLELNESIFNNVLLIKAEINKGVSSNCNTVFRSLSTDWLKIIAADDILDVDCISKNIDNAKKNGCKVIFSSMQAFNNLKKLDLYFPPEKQKEIFSANTPQRQLKLLRKHGGARCAPTSFIHREAIHYLNELDESFTLIEDYPMWLKLSEKYSFFYYDDVTVYYRYDESTSNSKINICNVNYVMQKIKIDKIELIKESNWRVKQHIKARLKSYSTQLFLTRSLDFKKGRLANLLIKISSILSLSKMISLIFRYK